MVDEGIGWEGREGSEMGMGVGLREGEVAVRIAGPHIILKGNGANNYVFKKHYVS